MILGFRIIGSLFMIQGFSNPSCLGYHIDIIIEETDKEQGLLDMLLGTSLDPHSLIS